MISEGVRFDQITVLTLCIRTERSEQTVYTQIRHAASGQGLHCLPLTQQFTHTFTGSETDLLKKSIK